MDKATYRVEGLHCAEEVQLVKKALGSSSAIIDLEFNILQEKLTVYYEKEKIGEAEIVSLIKTTGMKAIPWEKHLLARPESFCQNHVKSFFLLASFLFLFAAWMLHYFSHPDLSHLFGIAEDYNLPFFVKGLYLLSILSSICFVLPKAYYSLRQLKPDMNLLMVIAVFGAIAIQQWFEAATVSFLFGVALLLEKWSVDRARKAISSLLALSPKKARVIDKQAKTEKEVEIENVEVGANMLIRPGEKIPLDGIIASGHTSIDQSPITGESMPVAKEVGDEVFAGTINQEGAIECSVTKKAEETVLSKMIRLIEEARSKRSESEAWVETFAYYYTPLMLLFSVLVMILPPLFIGGEWLQWIYRGLVLLVIACPCALVISTPVSIVSGLTAAARNGVLIKGGIFLEEVGKLKALALDKTGTLTTGHPEVQKILPLNRHTEQELMERAYALEKPSEHPLARAIIRKAQEMGISCESATNFQSLKGKGAIATYNNKLYWIGSHRFMHEMGQETEEIHNLALQLEDAGHSIVAIGTEDHVCGLITIADAPKQNVPKIMEELKKEGVKHIVMLTGDNEPTAKALASYSGIDFYKSELLPEEKVEVIRNLGETWEKVGMVGDGVNDAPAMAAANIGFAMGTMGTDAAIETADITLMSDDLEKLPWLIRYSKRVMHVIKQNITFALGIKAIFIALALWNLTTLWMAIAADTGATLLVIFNALRLLRFKNSRPSTGFVNIYRQ